MAEGLSSFSVLSNIYLTTYHETEMVFKDFASPGFAQKLSTCPKCSVQTATLMLKPLFLKVSSLLDGVDASICEILAHAQKKWHNVLGACKSLHKRFGSVGGSSPETP